MPYVAKANSLAISGVFLPVQVLEQNAFIAVGVEGIALRVLDAELLTRVVGGRFCGREGVEGAIGVAAGALGLDPRACTHAM